MYEPHVAKLWGPYVAMKGIYEFTPLPYAKAQMMASRPNFKQKKEESIARDTEEVYLPGSPTSIHFLFSVRRQFNLIAFKKLPIRKLWFPVHFYCIFQSCVIRAGHIPMGAEDPNL